VSIASPAIRVLPECGSETSRALQSARVAWGDERPDAAEQLLVAVEQPGLEFRPVEEVVGDQGVRESLLVVLALDDEFGVGEEEVAATVIGMQVGVDDVGDVGDLETDLGESRLEPVLCVRDASRYRRGRFRRRCG
jgi:hypothetical protein